jgi:hypothetical protein
MSEAAISERPSLERRLYERAQLVKARQAVYWSLGDLDAQCIREFGRGVIGSLADNEGVTKAYIRDRINVVVTFPEGTRHADVSPCIYQASMRAAHRTGGDPHHVLQQALSEGWAVRDLNVVGLANKGPVMVPVLRRLCEGCGYEVQLRRPETQPSVKAQIQCEVCRSTRGESVPLGMIR